MRLIAEVYMGGTSNIVSRILNGCVDARFYEKNRAVLDARNYKNLRIISIGLTVIGAFFALMCFATPTPLPTTQVYVEFTIAYAVMLALVTIYLKDHQDRTNLFYGLCFALAFAHTLIASTVLSPDNRMVSVFFTILILPALHIERPIRSYLTLAVSCAIALIAVHVFKSIPSIILDDTASIVLCLAAGIPFISLVRNSNLSNIEAMQYYQVKAEVDKLTGICNRESAEVLIRTSLTESDGPSTLLIIDIDDFKQVNDTMGHIRGDEVLAAVGGVLRENFRHGDVVGRIGGDEFVAFMPGTDSLEIIDRKAKSIQDGISKVMSDLTTQRLTCSIGVAARTDTLCDFKSLYDAADKALYWAKAAGKNRYELFREKRHTFKRDLPLMLVADDAQDSRAILRACFQNEFNIIEAVNGRQALDMVHEYGVELAVILLDLRMPEVDGTEVIRILRANRHLCHIPIVVISAYNETELSTLKLGANDMLEKPFDPEVCRIRVRNAIASAR